MKAYNVFKTGHVVDVFMFTLITHQSKQRCPYMYIAYMHVGKNIGTGMLVLLPSVNMLRFKSREIPTFSFCIDWFIRNYKAQTDSKLPESCLCAQIILKTFVLQGRFGKGAQLNIGEFVLRQK